MGSSASKNKVKGSTNNDTIYQPTQTKSYEFKADEITNEYNQAKLNNIMQNQKNCNNNISEPTNDLNILPICKITQQQQHKLTSKTFNENVCEYPKLNIPQHPNFQLLQQDRNLCKNGNLNIQQRIDQQNINSQLSNNVVRNMNRNLSQGRFQQCLDNQITASNQLQQLNLNDNQQYTGKTPIQAHKGEKMKEFDQRKQLEPQFNNFYNNQQSQQVASKSIYKSGNIQQFPLFFQQQQQRKDEEIKQKPQQSIKILEIIEVDYIDIYNQMFNKQTQGRFSNKFPCKHSKCQTVAHINVQGNVTCEKGCASFPINQAIFNNKKNTIFRFNKNKEYDLNKYKQITNELELVQIFQDSLKYSDKTESEKEKFQIQLIHVVFNHFAARKRQNSIS